MKFEDLVVLVTGGASGIGESIVRKLILLKSKVVICDLQTDKGQALEKEFKGQARFIKCDITSEKDVEDMVNQVEKEFGRLDSVINSAGIVGAELIASEKGMHSKNLYDKIMKVNTFGSFNVSRYCAKLMIKNAKPDTDCNGSIVFLASLAGIEGQKGQTAYAASKGALIGMTLPMARDLGRYKIRVNTVAPGLIETPMTGKMSTTKGGKAIMDATPLKRFGRPDEVADTCLFCLSNDFLNGTTIRIDGGIRFPHF
jgi:NAD(P)-dependent dehydrogenase (short-subunit alcohol dehydrogenase family)